MMPRNNLGKLQKLMVGVELLASTGEEISLVLFEGLWLHAFPGF